MDEKFIQGLINNSSSAGQYAGSQSSPRYEGLGSNVSVRPSAPKQNFFSNLGQQVVNAGKAIGSEIANTFYHEPAKFGTLLGQSYAAHTQNPQNLKSLQDSISQAQKSLTLNFSQGKLSRSDYQRGMDSLAKLMPQYKASTAGPGLGEIAHAGLPVAATVATLGGGLVAKGAIAGSKIVSKIPWATRLAGGLESSLGVGKSLSNPLAAVAGKLARIELVAKPIAQQGVKTAEDIQSGNIKNLRNDAVFWGSVLAGGKILEKGLPIAGKAIKNAFTGVKGGPIVEFFGEKAVQNASPAVKKILAQAEEFSNNQSVKNVNEFFHDFLVNELKVNKADYTVDQFARDFKVYAKNNLAVQEGIAAGKLPVGAVAAKDFSPSINKLVSLAKKGNWSDLAERARMVDEALADVVPSIRSRLKDVALNANSAEELEAAAKQFKKFNLFKGVELDKGYVATHGPKVQAQLNPLDAVKTDLKYGKAPAPVLGKIGAGLKKIGLGLEDADTRVWGIAKKNFEAKVTNGRQVFEDLLSIAQKKEIDPRTITKSEIMSKLDVSRKEATAIKRALASSFREVPLSVQGLAGKLQSTNLRYNPIAAPYSRLQNTLRYKTPVFRGQQNIEATTLGQVLQPGVAKRSEVDAAVKLMRSNGFIPEVGGLVGEGIESTGLPKITGRLTHIEERRLGAQLVREARAAGTTPQELLKDHTTRELLRSVVQHKSEGVLSSNLAKGLNLATFPLTYNVKVTSLAAKALLRQPPAVQFGVLHGIKQFKDFLGTDEGIRWQSQNSEIIGLLNYFTPVNSIQSIYNAVANRNVRDLGVIGGLPFGVIIRVLEGQGLIQKSNPPYVNPKTGEVIPDRIPESDKAKLQQFLRDVIETVFTFPGRQAGLASKRDVVDAFTGNLLKMNPNETRLNTNTRELTGAQKRQVEVLNKKSAETPFKFKNVPSIGTPLAPLQKLPKVGEGNYAIRPPRVKSGRSKIIPPNLRIR